MSTKIVKSNGASIELDDVDSGGYIIITITDKWGDETDFYINRSQSIKIIAHLNEQYSLLNPLLP